MGRIRRGWELTTVSWCVLCSDRSLAAFPVLGGLAALALAVAFGLPSALLFGGDESAPALILALGIYAATFAGVFFNVALAAAPARWSTRASSSVRPAPRTRAFRLSSWTAQVPPASRRCGPTLAYAGAEERLAGVREGWPGPGPLAVFSVGEGPSSASQVVGTPARPSAAAGEVLARAALSRRPRPAMLLALNDTLAASALHAAHWMGLDVPGDISVAGLDDPPGSAALGLTTALIPYQPLGERAGDLLTVRLAGEVLPDFPDLPTALTSRRSTGPPPSAVPPT